MIRIVCAVCVCLASFQALGQTASKYQPATITEVRVHQPASGNEPNGGSYEVSLKIGDTIYQVLYAPVVDTNVARYAAGREILVLVKEKTIRYNDLLGQPYDLPIISRKSASKGK
jgi:hypothetical protein